MEALEDKLIAEVDPDSQIVACRFPLKRTPPSIQIGEGIDSVWIYDKTTVLEWAKHREEKVSHQD